MTFDEEFYQFIALLRDKKRDFLLKNKNKK